MTFRSRRSALATGNDQILFNALLLLICAIMSALGAGLLGVLVLLPAALIAGPALSQIGRRRQSAGNGPAAGHHSAAMRGH